MPNRMLRESLLVSEQVNGLGWFEEVCFTRLILCADDFGRVDGRCVLLAARMFPLRRDVEVDAVAGAVDALAAAGLVARYEVDGRPYLQLPGWERNQKLHYRRARCPEPCVTVATEEGKAACDPPADALYCAPSREDARGGGMAGTRTCAGEGAPVRTGTALEAEVEVEAEAEEKEKRDTQTARAVFFAREPEFGAGAAAFVPPGADEVRRYVEEHGYEVDPVRFVDFYNSKGWMVGTSPMRSWRAAVNIWQGNLKAEQDAAARIAAREGRALRMVPGGGAAGGAAGWANPFAGAEENTAEKEAAPTRGAGYEGGVQWEGVADCESGAGAGFIVAGGGVQGGTPPGAVRP